MGRGRWRGGDGRSYFENMNVTVKRKVKIEYSELIKTLGRLYLDVT